MYFVNLTFANVLKQNSLSSCAKKQDDFNQLKRAKLEKIDLFTHKCKFCNKIFSTETEANIHVRRSKCRPKEYRKRGPIKNCHCDDCNKTFSSREAYYSHYRRVHSVAETYECPYCSKVFKYRKG